MAAGRCSLTENDEASALEAEKKIQKLMPKLYWDEDILRIQNESRRYLAEQQEEVKKNGEEE